METLPITLIVKAPNQQIEDQTIKCELSWTINKLKQHLSEVYPSKPPKHEQKLIYSGQLLSDSVTLKDILRQYEGQETHTVHLVCASKQHTLPEKTNQASRLVIPEQLPQTPPSTTTTTTTPTATTNPNTTTPMNGHEFPNIWTNPPSDRTDQFARDPNQYAIQLAMMQQAYLQYMTQYMQLAATSYGVPQNQPVLDENAQQQQPPPPPQPQPAPIRDPDNPERDWLDVFYMLSRVMILFSVVYFYSSPIRFIFVLLLGFALYLYQIGFFRSINHNNNNNNNNHHNNNNNNTVPGNNDPTIAGQEQQEPEQQQQDEQAPSRLMIVWTFFTTFFASLIPEIPNAV